MFGGCAEGERLERVKASAQFKDGAFRNTADVSQGLKKGTALSTLGEYFAGKQARTPPGPLPVLDPREAWAKAPSSALRTTWLGHSSVLLELEGTRVLTDPVFGLRASPYSWAGPKRFHEVPATVEALPTLDAVIVSHDHYDHLDFPTIVELAKRDVPFITSLGVGAHLQAWGVPPERIIELDWWESTRVRNVTITAAPSQHFSGRAPGLGNKTLWSSFAIQSAKAAVFFSGDTGLTQEYTQIRERLGRFDLVMLEIGAWHESWGQIHLGPKNALAAHAMLGSGALMPVHWGTFNLAIHAWDEPPETLLELAKADGRPLAFSRLGKPFEPTLEPVLDLWWREVRSPEAKRLEAATAR